MHSAAAHRGQQRVGQLHGADLLALRFDVDRTRRVEPLERRDQLALERLLRRLRVVRQVAEQRAAMPRERFEVEHLRAFGGERREQAALAGTGQPADHLEAEACRAASRARATTWRRYAR